MVRIFRQYYSGYQIKQNGMGGTRSTNRTEEEILVGKLKSKGIFGKYN
jgi:hypothetical protein